MIGQTCKNGHVYAVHHGDYAGQMFIYVDKDKNLFKFLSIPEMINVSISKEKFDFGIRNGIIEFVEQVPKDMHKISLAQFKQNEKNQSNN